ncbi:unnamed protein product [Acanthoscelides obtectus]|uniref:C2H2-type domain-containing protein n=1 Tax=Acanthoscelides obtectus TaxID=200917 RepID=A0A9P0KPN8_ACAOB|nr:unnamed protein product [Acanthoscelides obtectus]CAK1664821.1 Zinc finger protein 358 [Acanthoscelides obtectus]
METQNHLDVKEFEVTQITHELTIKRENGATFKIQKMKMENDNQITHELTFKSENGEVSGIKEEKIDAENDFNREFGAPQIAQVFIKDEFAQSIDTAAANTVLDRFYDAHNTKANDDHALMRFAGEEVLKGQDKNKNDVQRFTNKNTEIILNSTTNGNCFTNPWIKCEAVEDLKLDNDFCGITEITEEYEIKNEDDHIIKHPSTTGSHLCSHCNVTFRKKRSLDDHIIKQHPDKIAEVSCKIHTCTHCEYRTTRNDHLAHHMLKHPGADGGYKLKKCVHCNRAFRWKATLDDHIIKKHPNYTSLVSSKIHECKYCVFKTTLKNCLTKHMEKHLGAEAVYKLNRCNTTSASKKDLDDHIINHKHYICIYCNAIFRRTRSLDDHIIRKHPDCIADISSNIYACAHCKYRTTVRESLVRHMLKHPGAGGDYKPNKCVHCKGKFRHKTTLDNHIIKKHPDVHKEMLEPDHNLGGKELEDP